MWEFQGEQQQGWPKSGQIIDGNIFVLRTRCDLTFCVDFSLVEFLENY